MAAYARLCAWTLARAHARSGDATAIASYLGEGDRFDRALAAFAEAYADQNERDYGRARAGRRVRPRQHRGGVSPGMSIPDMTNGPDRQAIGAVLVVCAPGRIRTYAPASGGRCSIP